MLLRLWIDWDNEIDRAQARMENEHNAVEAFRTQYIKQSNLNNVKINNNNQDSIMSDTDGLTNDVPMWHGHSDATDISFKNDSIASTINDPKFDAPPPNNYYIMNANQSPNDMKILTKTNFPDTTPDYRDNINN